MGERLSWQAGAGKNVTAAALQFAAALLDGLFERSAAPLRLVFAEGVNLDY